MRPVLSRSQIRAFDQHAIQSCGVPSLILMENAGRGAADAIARRFNRDQTIAIVCGPGNNGGDGFVAGRHLLARGFDVHVSCTSPLDELTGDAACNAKALTGLGADILVIADAASAAEALLEADVIVDALFGTGLSRDVAGMTRELIESINAKPVQVVSLDIPSGLDADTGQTLGACIKATLTVTFAHPKLGLYSGEAGRHTGEVEVVDIGVSPELYADVGSSAWIVDESDIRTWLRSRVDPAHKGEAGRVLIVAGSDGTLGAARLAAHAALRAGAGLVKIATLGDGARQLQATSWEMMTASFDDSNLDASMVPHLEWADAIVLGPGLGRSDAAVRLCDCVVQHASRPLIIDADGLNCFEGRTEALLKASAELLLTPHPREASRLLGCSTEEIERDRFTALQRLLELTKASVLLKGVHTLVGASTATLVPVGVNTTGNSALATAGSGDVLAGLLGALTCQLGLERAALAGAWLHGACAEALTTAGRHRGILAREIADEFPRRVAALRGP